VAFLRAINVAGHARVTMNEVRDAFAAAGCQNVQTCIQSGNILFESPVRASTTLVQQIRNTLGDVLDEAPQVLLRTAEQVEDLVRQDPFRLFQDEADVKRYVAFLAQRPRRKVSLPLAWPKEALEAVGMSGPDVFVVSRPKPNGFFGFPNAFVEEEFGTCATSRNWSTITKIVQLVRRQAES
jgi:uncharacterized protein (DUF1697 family)